MSEYAVMPLTDYKNTCDAIRAKMETSEPIKSGDMAENIPKVYEAGKQAEYAARWDAINKKLKENGGIYTQWFYTFAGLAWNDDTFKPPFDIKPDGDATGLFYGCGISNLKEILEEQEVELDTSKIESANAFFRNSSFITHAPKMDWTNAKNIGYAFYSCRELLVVEGVVFSEITGTTSAANIFNGTNELYRFIASGIIAVSLSVKDLKKLDKPSITSFMNTLSPTVTGKTFTFSKEAVNNAFGIDVDDETTYPEGSEWYELRNSKSNWTISYV